MEVEIEGREALGILGKSLTADLLQALNLLLGLRA